MSKIVGSDADTKLALNYKLGITYDFSVTESFYVIPGLELVNKSWKSDVVDGTINMIYAQVPVLAAYKFQISDGVKLAVKAGPYAGVGLFGSKIKFEGNNREIGVFDSNGGYQRFDAGIKAGIAIEFDQFLVGAEYSRGFVKLDNSSYDFKQYPQTFGLVLGYKL